MDASLTTLLLRCFSSSSRAVKAFPSFSDALCFLFFPPLTFSLSLSLSLTHSLSLPLSLSHLVCFRPRKKPMARGGPEGRRREETFGLHVMKVGSAELFSSTCSSSLLLLYFGFFVAILDLEMLQVFRGK